MVARWLGMYVCETARQDGGSLAQAGLNWLCERSARSRMAACGYEVAGRGDVRWLCGRSHATPLSLCTAATCCTRACHRPLQEALLTMLGSAQKQTQAVAHGLQSAQRQPSCQSHPATHAHPALAPSPRAPQLAATVSCPPAVPGGPDDAGAPPAQSVTTYLPRSTPDHDRLTIAGFLSLSRKHPTRRARGTSLLRLARKHQPHASCRPVCMTTRSPGKQVVRVCHGLKLDCVAAGVEEEHGPLLAGLAHEPQVRLDLELDTVAL